MVVAWTNETSCAFMVRTRIDDLGNFHSTGSSQGACMMRAESRYLSTKHDVAKIGKVYVCVSDGCFLEDADVSTTMDTPSCEYPVSQTVDAIGSVEADQVHHVWLHCHDQRHVSSHFIVVNHIMSHTTAVDKAGYRAAMIRCGARLQVCHPLVGSRVQHQCRSSPMDPAALLAMG